MKQRVATALLVIGTIVGTLGGAHLPTADWRIVGAGLALLAAGALLMRRVGGASAPARAAAHGDLLAALAALPERVDQLAAEAASLDLVELRRRIDRVNEDAIQPIAESSPELLPVLGATRFADLFGVFASGERLLARAWSAAADEHREEALSAVALAAERIREAAAAARRSAESGGDR